jgi:hypothetical protein
MKIRELVIAGCVLLVLTGFLYWSEHHKPAEESANASADTPPAILKLDGATVTKLELKKKGADPIQLSKAASGEWQITEPKPLRADQSTVSSMLSTLSSLNSERLVEDKASDLSPFGLQQPALEVDITEKDNKGQKLLMGDDTPTGSAIYAMLAGDLRVFTVGGYIKTSVDKGVNDLRDKRLLTVNPDKITRIEIVRKNQDIEFGRNNNGWQILKPKPLRADGTQVGDLVHKLTDAKMDLNGSSDGNVNAAFSHATPVGTAIVTDESGKQQVEIRKGKDVFYAKSSTVDGAYKVQSDLASALDKNLDDFRNKKLFDFGFDQPSKIELRNGSKAYVLDRDGKSAEWWSTGKKMDAASVQALISKLRDLTASKFAESGFSTPTIEAAVISEDGRRTEKILVSKRADRYLAKRENEAALYELDAGSVEALLTAGDEIKPSGASDQNASKKP